MTRLNAYPLPACVNPLFLEEASYELPKTEVIGWGTGIFCGSRSFVLISVVAACLLWVISGAGSGKAKSWTER